MFTERKRIKAHYFEIYKDKLFILEDDCSPLYVYDIHTFHLIAKLGDNYGGGLYAIKDLVVDEHLKGVNVDTLSKVPSFYNCSNTYYYITNSKYIIIRKFITDFSLELHIVRLDNYQIVRKIKDTSGTIRLFTESNDLICSTEDFLFLYKDFTLLWQKDLSKLTQYTEWDGTEEEGKIREVYEYQDSVIVLTQMFILRIDLQTGDIVYSLQLPAGLMELSIVGDKAYGCYGYHYMEVDIEKGKLLNFVRIENAVYQGKEYNAIMDSPKFHEGYVFHGVRLEGGYYAISALDAQTEKRIWIDLLGTYMVEKIEFYEDKMFVLDTGGYLHIYEKEDV